MCIVRKESTANSNSALYTWLVSHFCSHQRRVSWCVLVLELIFEVIIRPGNYFQLVESDKAFAPSTARYISRFHLVFEALALATFIPSFRCTDEGGCEGGYFNLVLASAAAVRGPTHADAANGRFLLGLTSLRFFGVIRHWKQMWINNTFQATKREGIERWLFPRERSLVDSNAPVSTPRRHLLKRNKRYVRVDS